LDLEYCVCVCVLYSTVQYSTIQYSTIQYNTVQYSTIQYIRKKKKKGKKNKDVMHFLTISPSNVLLSILYYIIFVIDYYIMTAVAAGMMIAASYSLLNEGTNFDDPHDTTSISATVRTAIGGLVGLIFINLTERLLADYEDLTVGGLAGADAKRALLIFFVMTLHSFSEGVGIGVSFGGAHGSELGVFISASLAVHNIPEGLAMAVTLMPRGTTLATAVVFAILTSLPQPLMAVPAYEFVYHFIPILPAGLGFAGGAMAWVALFELLKEAVEDSGLVTTAFVSTASLIGMRFLNDFIDQGARS
jgi:ZIP family zinc transporter